MPLFRADHDWSPAIDQTIETPVQATRPPNGADRQPGRAVEGRKRREPQAREAEQRAPPRTTLPPPTQTTLASPDVPPKNTAANTSAPAAAAEHGGAEARSADQPARLGAVHPAPPYHPSRAGHGPPGDRFDRQRHSQFVYPEPTHGLPPTERLPIIGRAPSARNRSVKAFTLVNRRRSALLAIFALAGLALAALTSAPAMAKQKTCAEQIVDDWYDNQRVDKLYPVHCYREAISGLPIDIKDYSDAQDAILRALAYRQANEPDPGASGGSIKPIAYRNTSDAVVEVGVGPGTDAAGQDPASSTAGPSSVPIPLIVLAGLAGLLLIAGGTGYVARRVQSRRGDPPSTP